MAGVEDPADGGATDERQRSTGDPEPGRAAVRRGGDGELDRARDEHGGAEPEPPRLEPLARVFPARQRGAGGTATAIEVGRGGDRV